MKALGVVRKVDRQGRIAIPKEIRKILDIKNGDPIEIFSDEEGVYLKKYKPSIHEQNLESAVKAMENLKNHGQINRSDIDLVIECLRNNRV